MKTFLHVMKIEKFTNGITEFYDTFFSNMGHEICYFRSECEDSFINEGIDIRQFEFELSSNKLLRIKDLYSFLTIIKKYDYIVIHSMFIPKWLILALASSDRLLKKIVWIEWGYDLYNFRTVASSIKERLYKNAEIKIREQCNTVVCIFPPDCEYYQKKFPKHSAAVFYAPYCGAKIPEEYLHYSNYSRLRQTNEENDTLWIQVGHSAVNQIDHIGTLKVLEKFKDENIKILLPLSYGYEGKADLVQEYAEKMFPGKTICLREFLPREKYFSILDRVDIAIFDTTRQIALGNLNRLAFRNTKIYLTDDSIMFNYFKGNGVPVQPISSIDKQSFEDFRTECEIVDDDAFQNYLSNLSNIDRHLQFWVKIYDNLSRNWEES